MADGSGKLTILVAEKLGKAGIDMLRAYGTVVEAFDMSQADLCAKVSLCDALIVRSATKVRSHAPGHLQRPDAGQSGCRRCHQGCPPSPPGAAAASDSRPSQLYCQVTREVFQAGKGRLKVVGRAGVGIDNVDLAAATEYGVLVVNAPTANTIAAAEHGIALLCSMSRNVAQADASMKVRLPVPRDSPCFALRCPCRAWRPRSAEGGVEAHQVCGHLAGGQDAGRHRLRQGASNSCDWATGLVGCRR